MRTAWRRRLSWGCRRSCRRPYAAHLVARRVGAGRTADSSRPGSPRTSPTPAVRLRDDVRRPPPGARRRSRTSSTFARRSAARIVERIPHTLASRPNGRFADRSSGQSSCIHKDTRQRPRQSQPRSIRSHLMHYGPYYKPRYRAHLGIPDESALRVHACTSTPVHANCPPRVRQESAEGLPESAGWARLGGCSADPRRVLGGLLAATSEAPLRSQLAARLDRHPAPPRHRHGTDRAPSPGRPG